jgi:hypothetical protein
MLSKLVKLKRYKNNGQDYYKVSDFLNTFDDTDRHNEYILDGLERIPRECFSKDRKYVSTQAIADLLMF